MYTLDTLADALGFTLVASTLFLFPVVLGIYFVWKTVERLIRGPDTPEDSFRRRRQLPAASPVPIRVRDRRGRSSERTA